MAARSASSRPSHRFSSYARCARRVGCTMVASDARTDTAEIAAPKIWPGGMAHDGNMRRDNRVQRLSMPGDGDRRRAQIGRANPAPRRQAVGGLVAGSTWEQPPAGPTVWRRRSASGSLSPPRACPDGRPGQRPRRISRYRTPGSMGSARRQAPHRSWTREWPTDGNSAPRQRLPGPAPSARPPATPPHCPAAAASAAPAAVPPQAAAPTSRAPEGRRHGAAAPRRRRPAGPARAAHRRQRRCPLHRRPDLRAAAEAVQPALPGGRDRLRRLVRRRPPAGLGHAVARDRAQRLPLRARQPHHDHRGRHRRPADRARSGSWRCWPGARRS